MAASRERASSARLRSVMSRMIPTKLRWSPNRASATDSSIGKTVPLFRRPSTSLPMPMIRFSRWPGSEPGSHHAPLEMVLA